MADYLASLGGLTLSGSAVICALALASRSNRSKLGPRWRCWVWLLLCLRLSVPLSLPFLDHSRNQPLVQIPALSDTVLYQRPVPPVSSGSHPGSAAAPNAGGVHAPASPAPSHRPPVSPSSSHLLRGSLSLSQLLTLLWLVGAVVFLLWTLSSHLRFLAYLRRWAAPVSDSTVIALCNLLGDQLQLNRRPRLLVCPGLSAPMLAGLFHPSLLLPDAPLDQPDLRYSLLHELTHLRRRDIWLKALALWVNAVHWFNPLVWYMVRLIERDIELACDEAALGRLPSSEHAAYGRTILAAAERLKP